MEQFRQIMAIISNAVDSVGVLIVVVGTFAATFSFLVSLRSESEKPWCWGRQRLGQSILLSLEFLIVLIRTFWRFGFAGSRFNVNQTNITDRTTTKESYEH